MDWFCILCISNNTLYRTFGIKLNPGFSLQKQNSTTTKKKTFQHQTGIHLREKLKKKITTCGA